MKGRKTRGVGGQRARRRGLNQPAGLRGAGMRRRGHAQHQNGDAGGLRNQGQAPAGGEVERARRPPGRDDDAAQRGAARGLGPGPQRGRSIARAHEQKLVRLHAKFAEARRIKRSGLGVEKILPHPAYKTPRRGPAGQPHDKTGHAGAIADAWRVNLVHGGAQKPAIQMSVQSRNAKREGFRGRGLSPNSRVHGSARQALKGKGYGHHASTIVHDMFSYKSPKCGRSQAGRERRAWNLSSRRRRGRSDFRSPENANRLKVAPFRMF